MDVPRRYRANPNCMSDRTQPLPIALLRWHDPETGDEHSTDLYEGARLTIGRAATNEICIPQHHVSRQHAQIEYQDGMFLLTDLGSANGTFLNDQLITTPTPLMAGDRIRLYTPELDFVAITSDETTQNRISNSLAAVNDSGIIGVPRLIFLSGPQKDDTVILSMEEIRIGRATHNHNWEIGIQDPSVSRPHARLTRIDNAWVVYDLGSSNGTQVNSVKITEKGKVLSMVMSSRSARP